MVGLRCALRRQVVWPSRKRSDSDTDREVGQRKICSSGCIRDLVLEFQIRKTDGVGEAAGVEIQTNNVVSRVVLVLVDRETGGEEGRIGRVLEVAITIEETCGLGYLIIQPAHQFVIVERSRKETRERTKRRAVQYRC